MADGDDTLRFQDVWEQAIPFVPREQFWAGCAGYPWHADCLVADDRDPCDVLCTETAEEAARRVSEEAVSRLRSRSPMSFVRFNDGESRALCGIQPTSYFRANMGYHGPFKSRDCVEVSRQSFQGVESATHVALPLPKDEAEEKTLDVLSRAGKQVLFRSGILNDKSVVPFDTGYVLGTTETLWRPIIDAAASVVVVTSRMPVVERIREMHSSVVPFLIPGEGKFRELFGEDADASHWPTLYRQICDDKFPEAVGPGTLVLVGAGVLKTAYTDAAVKLGAVVLDLGSVFDRWCRVPTRGPDVILWNKCKYCTAEQFQRAFRVPTKMMSEDECAGVLASLPPPDSIHGTLGYVVSYFETSKGLHKHLGELSRLPDEVRGRLEIVVVDDASSTVPICTDDMVRMCRKMFRTISPARFVIARVQDDRGFNNAAAKSIGVSLLRSSRVFMTDLDTPPSHATGLQWFSSCMSLGPNEARRILSKKGNVAAGTFAFHRSATKIAGLYQQKFFGHYGAENQELMMRWLNRGIDLQTLPSSIRCAHINEAVWFPHAIPDPDAQTEAAKRNEAVLERYVNRFHETGVWPEAMATPSLVPFIVLHDSDMAETIGRLPAKYHFPEGASTIAASRTG
jgi:hypothetical protein